MFSGEEANSHTAFRAPNRQPEFREASGASIPCQIAFHAHSCPNRIAVADGAATLTFGDLDARSNQFAAHLLKLGIRREGCVALLLDRSVDFVVAALATMKAGGAYLPLDTSTPADRVKSILSDSGAQLLISHRGRANQIAQVDAQLVELDGAAAAQINSQSANAIDKINSASDLAYIIYTSGSTGVPKGVEISHSNLLNLIDWHNAAFNVTPDDRASQVAGLGFDAAVWEIWPALSAGATLVFADEITRRSPQALRDWIVAERITISFAPTVLAEQLLHTAWPKETALRTLLTGADTLHRRPIEGLPFVLVNNYGPTECTVVATSGVVHPETQTGSQPSIGRAIANTSAVIVDEHLRPVAPGEPGELCLSGAHVGRGYRNNPKLTAGKFVSYSPPAGPSVRLYRTGDRARLLANGEIAFLGRVDDQVKIRGYRIELGEIVACLDRISGVEASAAVVRNDDPTGELYIAAYVVAAATAKLTTTDLRSYLGARLPDYMIPARFVAIPSLPITANGKLDKAALPAPGNENQFPTGVTTEVSSGAASSGSIATTEDSIATMVAALLGRPTVARNDNFFMLGGHSMLGAQLVARIRDTFGVKLTLRQLFGAPTVAALTAEVARLATGT